MYKVVVVIILKAGDYEGRLRRESHDSQSSMNGVSTWLTGGVKLLWY